MKEDYALPGDLIQVEKSKWEQLPEGSSDIDFVQSPADLCCPVDAEDLSGRSGFDGHTHLENFPDCLEMLVLPFIEEDKT